MQDACRATMTPEIKHRIAVSMEKPVMPLCCHVYLSLHTRGSAKGPAHTVPIYKLPLRCSGQGRGCHVSYMLPASKACEQSTADSPHKKLTVGERNSQRPPLSAKWKDRYHTVQKGAKVKADGKIKKLISFANDNSEQCSKTAQEQAEMDRKQSVKVRKDKAQVAR